VSRIKPIIYLFHHLARRPAFAMLLLMLIALGSCVLASLLSGHPQPLVHDEFSYLLAADTFAQGRIANPKHPLWQFFETMHVVHDPSYASMYPPGQGLALAVGQVATGDPAVGVWLSIALMTGAIYWMLLGWMPRRWALLGGVLVICKFIVLGRGAPLAMAGYWSQSYFGGAVAAIGGALLYGALARIIQFRGGCAASSQNSSSCQSADAELPCPLNSVLLAVGVAMLANSRPFEGMIVSLPAAITLLIWLLKRPRELRKPSWLRVALPAAIVLLITFACMGYYNHRVTGKATRMAWEHHHDQYCTFPIFVWQRPKMEMTWNHEELKEFHGFWEVDLWMRHRSAEGLAVETGRKLRTLWAFYLAGTPRLDQPIEFMEEQIGKGPVGITKRITAGMSIGDLVLGGLLTLPLLSLPWVLRRRGMKLALLCCVGAVLANLVTVATFPHYAAPMTALVMLLIVQCLRHTRAQRNKTGTIVFAVVIGVSMVLFVAAFNPPWRAGRPTWHLERARFLAEMEQIEGNHLIVVRYGQGHSVHNEWVFNRADIDGAKVVFARDMGEEKNKALLDYYSEKGAGGARHIWMLEVSNDRDADVKPTLTLRARF